MVNRRLVGLFVALLGACLFFLVWGVNSHFTFILQLRAVKLGNLVVVGAAIGVATMLFQTLSNNRILTPSIMGFDALYLFMQSCMVFFMDHMTFANTPGWVLFSLNTAVMMLASVLLFTTVLRSTRHDIQMMILVGVIFGLLFRSFSILIQRMIDPSDFAMLQSLMFAQFTGMNLSELLGAMALLIFVCVWSIPKCAVFDVMALGRSTAMSLGVNYDRLQFGMLCAISALVSVSTALVGPIVFLGLLVSALTHSLMQTHRHAILLPAAALISALILIIGQTAFEHVLELRSTLSVIIEFSGGLFFLVLLSQGKIK